MEPNAEHLSALSTYLSNTLSPNVSVRRSAEQFLQSVEVNEGYARLLTALLQNQGVEPQIAVACSITLKNFVKRRWRARNDSGDASSVDIQQQTISENDRQFLKAQILSLMLTTHNEPVRRQLAETISLIGAQDFPDKWPDLLNELIAKMNVADCASLRCVLLTADSLFKHYAFDMKSDKLWREIKYVLDVFAAPLTTLFLSLCQAAQDNLTKGAGLEILKPIYECLVIVASIFYSLNAQDLPEFFEDHMREWMEGFLKLLSTDVPILRSIDDDTEAGVVEELWSQICDNIAMYAQKYDEEFQQYLPPFVGVVWQLLVSTGQQVKYDSLVSNAVQFLASICERHQYKHLFESGDTLAQICEKVIVPNIEFRSQDEELFEDNPEDFIRKDAEDSDVDTRRRSAADLVKALCKHFESDVIRIFSAYINQLFNQYSTDPIRFWSKKDAAIYLVVVLSSRGQTSKLGATKTSSLVDLVDFYRSQILPDLQDSDLNRLPVLKADALKYVVTFRSHLTKEILLTSVFPNCVRLLAADSQVVHSYAARAVERLLMSRDPQNMKNFVLTPLELAPLASSLLQNGFSILNKPGSSENEYAMKCIMRVCQSLSQQIPVEYAQSMLTETAKKIAIVSKNPSKPHFNHYLFETLCLLIKICQRNSVADDNAQNRMSAFFEDALFPPFEEILRNDVQEFMPYVFQVLALILGSKRAHSGLTDGYKALFRFLLAPELWTKSGNIPGLVALIQAYIKVGSDFVVAQHLMPVLGAFQSLLASKANDPYVFSILNSLIEYNALESLPRPTLLKIFNLIFTRISRTRTTKFVKNFVHFVSLFVLRYGPANLINLVEEIQNGLFPMFVDKIYLPDITKVDGKIEKNVCNVALIRFLTDSPDIMLNDKYRELWAKLLTALVLLSQNVSENGTGGDDDETDLDVLNGGGENAAGVEAGGYAAAYSQLIYACCADNDPTSGFLTNGQTLVAYFGQCLQKLSQTPAYGANLSAAVKLLDESTRNYVQKKISAAGDVNGP